MPTKQNLLPPGAVLLKAVFSESSYFCFVFVGCILTTAWGGEGGLRHKHFLFSPWFRLNTFHKEKLPQECKTDEMFSVFLLILFYLFLSQTTLSDPLPPPILFFIPLSFSLSLSPFSPEHVRCRGLIWLLRKSAVIEQTPSEIWWQMGPDPSKLLSAQIEISFSLLLTEMK